LDFYVAKGITETLLNNLGLHAKYAKVDEPSLETGVSAEIMISDEKVGVIGKVHHHVAAAFDISGEVFLFEINLERLFSLCSNQRIFRPVIRYPAVNRDLALVMDEGIAYGKIEECISHFKLVASIKLFDLYRGEQIPDGKKSLALRLLFQAEDHTLTDVEVDRAMKAILGKLNADFSIVLRD
jgi:phenylalanyl-tRNA synthetase beta chain